MARIDCRASPGWKSDGRQGVAGLDRAEFLEPPRGSGTSCFMVGKYRAAGGKEEGRKKKCDGDGKDWERFHEATVKSDERPRGRKDGKGAKLRGKEQKLCEENNPC